MNDDQMQELLDGMERTLDSLRELRRKHPELFFNQPAEELYRNWEEALDRYYRATMHAEDPKTGTIKNDDDAR